MNNESVTMGEFNKEEMLKLIEQVSTPAYLKKPSKPTQLRLTKWQIDYYRRCIPHLDDPEWYEVIEVVEPEPFRVPQHEKIRDTDILTIRAGGKKYKIYIGGRE